MSEERACTTYLGALWTLVHIRGQSLADVVVVADLVPARTEFVVRIKDATRASEIECEGAANVRHAVWKACEARNG